MSELIAVIFPMLITCGIGVFSIVFFYFFFFRQDLMFLGIVGVIVFFNSQLSGASLSDMNTIYGRGSGLLLLPILTWFLLFGFGVSFFGVFKKETALKNAKGIAVAYWMLLCLCLCHFMVGLSLGVVPKQVFSGNGLVSLFLSSIFFIWGLRTVNESKVKVFIKLLIVAIFIRCLFGLIRYFVMGGDPVNIYDNIEDLGVKVVFFDFHDSTLAAFLVLYSIGQCLAVKVKGTVSKLFYYIAVITGFLVILFSQHRSSLIGLLAGIGVVIIFSSSKHRLYLIIGLLLLGFIGISSITAYRLSKVSVTTSFMDAVVYDFKSKSSTGKESPRALEQKYAFSTFLENPVLGVGAWGKYKGYGLPWQDASGENGYQTVHNGFLQMALKTGLVGLSLLLMLLFIYIKNTLSFIKKSNDWCKSVHVAVLGSFAAMLPNIAIGMIMVQQRGLMLLALFILIPYAVDSIKSEKTTKNIGDETNGKSIII